MKKWEKKKSKALPLTPETIADLIKSASSAPPHSTLPCTRDSVILGSYTGSRCSEYCRGKRKKLEPFGCDPFNPNTEPFSIWRMAHRPCTRRFHFPFQEKSHHPSLSCSHCSIRPSPISLQQRWERKLLCPDIRKGPH